MSEQNNMKTPYLLEPVTTDNREAQTMQTTLQSCALTKNQGHTEEIQQDQESNEGMHAEQRVKYNCPTRADSDGITHINIDRYGMTELGRMLTHMYHLPFVHPEFGPFRSVEGFIGYIRSGGKDSQFHYAHGMNARYRSRNQSSEFISGFRQIVMEANYLKITQNEQLRDLMINSDLPFDHYYLFGPHGNPVRPRNASWLVPSFEELRDMLKEGKSYPPVDYTDVIKERV